MPQSAFDVQGKPNQKKTKATKYTRNQTGPLPPVLKSKVYKLLPPRPQTVVKKKMGGP